VLLAALLVTWPAAALAHGAATLSAKMPTAAAGGAIILSGDGLGEDGDKVSLTLKGMNYEGSLGTATLKDDSIDNANFTVPKDVPAGTYTIEAKNGSITASTQIEVTPAPASAQAQASQPGTMTQPAGQAEASPASQTATASQRGEMAQASQPVGPEVSVPVAQSPVQWAVAVSLVALTGLLAIALLWRSRSELTAIDV
ncbi:MAG: hypothetical protein KGJ86_03020, partial [Chloroflexota bacterium]|nr:hypothetical protein [Chloroflexota bacterium]